MPCPYTDSHDSTTADADSAVSYYGEGDSYAKPTAYLPASSTVPHVDGEDPSEVLTLALRAVADELDETVEQFQHRITPFPQIWKRLDSTRKRIGAVRRLVAGTYEALRDAHTRTSSELAVRNDLQQRDDLDASRKELLEADFCVQDRYFKVYRISSPSFEEYVGQVATTTARVLIDLPHATLAIDELTAILQMMQRGFSMLAHRAESAHSAIHGKAPAPAKPFERSSGEASANVEAFWAAPETAPGGDGTTADPAFEETAQTDRVALYRWINGHHLWMLCQHFTSAQLDVAAEAVDGKTVNEEKAQAALLRAATFLRGVPAAMWYAANSPSMTYRLTIRPSMLELAQSVGAESFSGVQNSDYTRTEYHRHVLIARLQERYGSAPSSWPTSLRTSMRTYHQTDIHSEEQHVLIAYSKVGTTAPSLAQEMKQNELPPGVNPMSAVEVLREMVDAKRSELPL